MPIGLSAYLLIPIIKISFRANNYQKQKSTGMIYIIDDDQNIRDAFLILLKSSGYKCSCYGTAEELLKNYTAGINDLIILDIHLAGMDGITLLEKMDKRKMHLPVIIVTAYDDQATRDAAKNYGALAYFRKPVDSAALIDAIKYHSDTQKSTNPNISQ
jgi:FixJ family two-component response regulator